MRLRVSEMSSKVWNEKHKLSSVLDFEQLNKNLKWIWMNIETWEAYLEWQLFHMYAKLTYKYLLTTKWWRYTNKIQEEKDYIFLAMI